MTPSPLAPDHYPELPPVAGVTLSTAACGVRYKKRLDVLLAYFTKGTQVAGVFTQSRVVAAPVIWCREALTKGRASALVVNAGNANAFTGDGGLASVNRVVEKLHDITGCPKHEVFMASTGVIGEPLPDDKITHALPALYASLSSTHWHDAARTIMTTDTFMKVATKQVRIGETLVTLNGIAKGSGMIAPNMATLLAFVFTDAAIPQNILQALLTDANQKSFNAITVDGDTSTNDTLMMFATGQASHPEIKSAGDAHLAAFKLALQELLLDLAVQIVRDGEGAQKLVTIKVSDAGSDAAAHQVGMTIANSPLVKTAIAGEDANWGRIVGAAGRAGIALDQNKISVSIGGVVVAQNGCRVTGYDETPVVEHMKGRAIEIHVALGMGAGSATVYTCDLTHGYIDINGSYRS